MKHNRRGFTLLEILIVVIIIGILATLAMPQFTKSVKKAKMAEAYIVLGAMRTAQLRYYASTSPSEFTNDPSKLDIDVPSSTYFDYTCVGGGWANNGDGPNGDVEATGKSGVLDGVWVKIHPSGKKEECM